MLRAALLAVVLASPGLLLAQGPAMPPPSPLAGQAMAQSGPATITAKPKVADAAPCSDYLPHFPPCGLSKELKKKAQHLYEEALKLAGQHRIDEALAKMGEVRAASPQDAVYAETQKALAGQVAADNMKRGTEAMMHGDKAAAARFFRRTVELDPTNEYARARLRSAEPPPPPPITQRLMDDGTVRLAPSPGTKSFHYRGSSVQFLEQFAKAYGITAMPQDNLTSRQVKINFDEVTWDEGLPVVARMCKALFIPMGKHELLIANDTEENRRDLMRMELRSFRLQGIDDPKELTDMFGALRVLFDLRFVVLNQGTGSILIKAPQPTIDAVQRFLDSLDTGSPEVTLDVKVFQISSDMTRGLGMTAPTSFTVFNIPSEVSSLLNSSTYSSIVQQLQALGQPVNATTILAALLASGSSLGSTSSPLSSPFATFGGGLTLSGVTIPSTTGKFNMSRSSAVTLEDMILRSQHGSAATLKVGQRYPIVTTQYSTDSTASSLLNSLGISSSSLSGAVAGALSSSSTPTSQFQYEDIGMVLKATPRVHGDLVSIEYEMTLRSLGATQVNGLPLMLNRDMKGAISTQAGQSVVLAGMVSNDEIASLNGIPILSAIPVLGGVFSVASREKRYDELLIVITPHIVSGGQGANAYIPVPMNNPR